MYDTCPDEQICLDDQFSWIVLVKIVSKTILKNCGKFHLSLVF